MVSLYPLERSNCSPNSHPMTKKRSMNIGPRQNRVVKKPSNDNRSGNMTRGGLVSVVMAPRDGGSTDTQLRVRGPRH